MVKKILCFSSLVIFNCCVFCQDTSKEHCNLAIFCKVWGFLKYYHPAIVRGKVDWDTEFIQKINQFQKLKSKREVNEFYFKWINDLDSKHPSYALAARTPEVNLNYDLKWLEDSSIFTQKVINLLISIQNAYHFRKSHYVKKTYFGFGHIIFRNEKAYADSSFPSIEFRLLSLARYWNIINYFYPYKYLLNENWDNTLQIFIPKFVKSNSVTQYNETLLELFAKVNDSHVGINPGLAQSVFQFNNVPFFTKIIDNKAVVTTI